MYPETDKEALVSILWIILIVVLVLALLYSFRAAPGTPQTRT